MIRRVLFLVVAMFLFGVPFGASAQEGESKKEFEDYIAEAKEAFDAEDYETAVDRLLSANRLQPNPRLLLNVAKSYDKLDDCKLALVYYRAFTRDPQAEPKLVELAQEELDRADGCEGYDASLSGRLELFSDPPGAAVSIDGDPVGTTPLEVAGLSAGKHTVSMTLEEYEEFSQEVELESAGDHTLEPTLEEKKEEPEEVAEVTPPPDDDGVEPREEEGIDPGYYVVGGLGAGGIGLVTLGLVMDLVAIPATDEQRSAFEPGDPQFEELSQKRSSQATLALIGYIGGSVLLAGSAGYLAYLMLMGSEEETTSPQVRHPRFRVAPWAGEHGGGFVLTGRF